MIRILPLETGITIVDAKRDRCKRVGSHSHTSFTMFGHRTSEWFHFHQLILISIWILASQGVLSPDNSIHDYRNEDMFVKRQLKLVSVMRPYVRFRLSSVLGFLVPHECSSRNWEEIMMLWLFYHSTSDLTTATGCCHYTRSSVTAITGFCDLLSFELLRIFAIWWASLLKCNLYIMVAVLIHTLTPPVERWCFRQRWKRCQNEKGNWRVVPAIRRLDTSAKNTIHHHHC